MIFTEIIMFIQSMKYVIYAVFCVLSMFGMLVLLTIDNNIDDDDNE